MCSSDLSGPGSGQAVRGLHQHGVNGLWRDVLVVSGHSVHDFRRFIVFFREVRTNGGMGTFHLVVHSLAQIMQQTRPLGFLHVKTKFRSHDAAQEGHFQGMLKHILGEAGPEPDCNVLGKA